MDRLKLIINKSEFEELHLKHKVFFRVSQDVPYFASVENTNTKYEIVFDYMFGNEPKEEEKKEGSNIVYGTKSGKIYKYAFDENIDVVKLITLNKSLQKTILAHNQTSKRYESNLKNLLIILKYLLDQLSKKNKKLI